MWHPPRHTPQADAEPNAGGRHALPWGVPHVVFNVDDAAGVGVRGGFFRAASGDLPLTRFLFDQMRACGLQYRVLSRRKILGVAPNGHVRIESVALDRAVEEAAVGFNREGNAVRPVG